MKNYLDTLTAHLKEVAKVRTFSTYEKEIEKIYQELRVGFLNNFFRKLAAKIDAKYERYEEKGDYVRFAVYFGKNYISNFKLYPFHVEVGDSFDMRPAREHLDQVEEEWIAQLTEALGETYTSNKEDNDTKTDGTTID